MSKPIDEAPLGSCVFTSYEPNDPKFSDVLAYYQQLRDYIKHEDGLVNWRMTWSLTVHGFLFGIYGLLLGKIADLLLDAHKNPPISLLTVGVISWMFLLQMLLAIFGAAIGYRSREAILAAHAAIQHLYTIGRASSLLGRVQAEMPPEAEVQSETVVEAAISALDRPQTITPKSMAGIEKNRFVLIDSSSSEDGWSNEEVIQIRERTDTTFEAIFSKSHASGTRIQLLAAVLLPKLIGGGDKGKTTRPAQLYYTMLPKVALAVWVVLGTISASLLFASIFVLREAVFRGTCSLPWLYN